MDNGTYILTFDKSQSVWGQKWYESIPINITSSGIEVLFPSDGNYYCYCDKEIAKEIHHSKNAAQNLKQNVVIDLIIFIGQFIFLLSETHTISIL